MNITVRTMFAAAIALTFAVGGCSLPPAGRIPITGMEASPTGALAVDVQNVRGAVEIIADPKITRADVCVLNVDGSDITPTGARGTNPAAYVASQIVPGDFGSVLRVVSADTASGPAPAMLLRIRVPTCDGLRVRTSEGGVIAGGVGGSIDILADHVPAAAGGIRVTTTRALNQPVSLVTSGGDITLTIPSTSDLVMEAQATGGNVKFISGGTRVSTSRVEIDRAEATIGGGKSPLTIRTSMGNVRVEVR